MNFSEYKFDNADCSLDGLKIAKVVNRVDAKAQERVWVKVIGVHDMKNDDPNYCIEAIHIAPSKCNCGEFPNVGDTIFGFFINEDPNRFYYIGWARVSK